ncbi:arylsulfatase [Metapseudomonas resinovorans]|uniref:Arylsulfatase n=1 Tax=Metapseudomonas resinovorans NBRC 106553 TaxID=1245471 RepID=S6AKW4_METRE|nr:arylsulfatase [Pseudomonas resinovorans]BAN45853.1 arylsulfatase [Pseudomonas resinovorans NBRC 106553]
MNLRRFSLALLASGAFSLGSQAADKPNVLIILADDLGYSDIGSFGGEIETPNIDQLAARGLRLTNFHTAPTCSPTRSMLLSGTDNHQAGLGNMGELMQDFQKGKPGYEGYLNQRVASLAEVMHDAGYNTYTTGKWHLGRTEELSPKARGFDRSFILVQGGASHFDDQKAIISVDPKAIYREDGKQVEVPKGFYSSAFYTDKLIDYIETDRKSGKPFLALLSYTAPHWPLHAPQPWLDKYRGRYDQGYEPVRQARLEKMAEQGIVPKGTTATTPMAGRLPNWSQLSDEQRKREARGMEVYAGMVDNMDFHIGRLLDYLRRNGELDNTMIVFLSDNGADGNSPVDLPGNREWFAKDFDNSYENIGRKGSYTDYGAQWAQVSATPFPYFKGFTRQGGITAPLIVKYPALIKEGGHVSHAFTHVMDLMPTILDVTGVSAPGARFRGREVQPMQGVSMVPALRGGDLPERAVGWELFGRKALRKGDWKMVWMGPPYGTAAWQLYNLAEDPAESRDLAAAEPAKLAELGRDWQAYAQRNNVLDGEFHIKYGFETCLYEFCFK